MFKSDSEELSDIFTSPPVSKIVINDYAGDMKISMEDSLMADRKDWSINGRVNIRDINILQIKNNTLYIDGSHTFSFGL